MQLALLAALLLPLAGSAALPAPGVDAAAVRQDEDGKVKKHPKLEHMNLSKKGLALEGYDPVSYFPKGGGKPLAGKKELSTNYLGVTYRFANEENRKAFLESPASYEPQYGGWCAWALADGKGEKVDPSPKSFTLEDGKLYLFYDGFWGDTRKKWLDKGAAPKLAPTADANWERITKPKKK